MLNIDGELQKLIETLQDVDPLEVPLEESLLGMVKFFERLLHASKHVTAENQKEWAAKVMEISQKMQGALKKFIDATGMSEEDLLRYADDAEKFPKEKWKQYQEARNIVGEFAKKIALLQVVASQEQVVEENSATAQESLQQKKKPPHPKRSTWMKS